MEAVAVIPARGGSKRIPNKSIRIFAGKPIIAYSIMAAKACGFFDKVIVSTDSFEIAEVASANGAEAPFIRPKELADDYIGTAPVLLHALNWLKEKGMSPNYFCCIYATAPFLQPQYLRKGYDLLHRNKATSAFSVSTFSFPIFRALKVNTDGRLEMFWNEYRETRSQDLPESYHDAGQFYWADTEKFLVEKTLYSENSLPVILPRHLVQDIDTLEDWETAELMYQAVALKGSKRRI